ncbi:hypothetical protein [Gemmatimonas sp.]|uniref:hypothetical protein n=1 Tax=Gemmatimonas sp. TaxID=1962908 RepID=UPI00398311D1
MSFSHEDVTLGLVVQLDTAVLRSLGGCQTNAVLGPEGDRSVVGTQDFLVVGLDAAAGRCTAVPLFAKTAVGNQPLENGKKSGRAEQWIGTDTFFSRWQHWRLPVASVVAASADDPATNADRRRYAATDRSALDDIKNWEGRNRASYRDA